jgi:hypothetical protein
VPHTALSTTVSEAVERVLEQHRAELVELVEQQVEAELERLAGELVAEAIARRTVLIIGRISTSCARPSRSSSGASTRRADETLLEVSPAVPRSQFNVDRSSPDSLRAACRSYRSEREYRPRARRARREKASPGRRGAPRDADQPRPAPAHVGNGRTPRTAARRRARADS